VPVGKVWPTHKSKGDYHGNFNTEMYMYWLFADAIPGCIELSRAHGDRPVTLIIDKAAYHVSMGPTGVNPFDLISGVESALREGCPRTITGVS
jgi:hypothetical protein